MLRYDPTLATEDTENDCRGISHKALASSAIPVSEEDSDGILTLNRDKREI